MGCKCGKFDFTFEAELAQHGGIWMVQKQPIKQVDDSRLLVILSTLGSFGLLVHHIGVSESVCHSVDPSMAGACN